MGWVTATGKGSKQMAELRVGGRQKPYKLTTGRGIFTHLTVQWLQPRDSRVLAAELARRNLSRRRQARSLEGGKLPVRQSQQGSLWGKLSPYIAG